MLERAGEVIGFVSFVLKPEKQVGGIKANGVLPECAGQGWGSFMYRQVLEHFRAQGIRFAYANTGLGEAHEAARRAYEAAGFGRPVPLVRYWQDLGESDPGD